MPDNNESVLSFPAARTMEACIASISNPLHLFTKPSTSSASSKLNKNYSIVSWIRTIQKKADGFMNDVCEHVRLGTNLSESLKDKLSLARRVLHAGGITRDFQKIFSSRKDEKLLMASHCYLSTTAGPIAGMFFISSEKIAFYSDRPVKLISEDGRLLIRIPYKVSIPLSKIKNIKKSGNSSKLNEKYVQIVTEDKFEFWFMGFLRFSGTFRKLQLIY